ncbi:MAG: RNA polymerase sigma-70 factor [Zetaproteobacteria bacterium]|nr:MAG: RNA polymerase sigma-70 factor [Zetaproteobacteria bacterium]
MTDEDLMARVQNADHEAFSVLVHRYTNLFYSAAYRMCGQQDDAEDIVQDAFLKLWNRPRIWDASRGAKFTTWFYRVVTNQAIDFMRKKKPVIAGDALDYVEDTSDTQQDMMEADEQSAMIEALIQALPERQKMALNLCFYEGLTNKDAAQIMGVGVKALESLLMRAKSGVREELHRRGILKQGGNGIKEKTYYG